MIVLRGSSELRDCTVVCTARAQPMSKRSAIDLNATTTVQSRHTIKVADANKLKELAMKRGFRRPDCSKKWSLPEYKDAVRFLLDGAFRELLAEKN
jgi:hypothetical protein